MRSLAGKYQLGEPIGGGGMAEVFRATALGAAGFERPVAVKRIKGSISRDPGFGRMFINEARIASLLHHPNIVSIVDFDQDDEGRYFLVMELVEGVDLRQLTRRGRAPGSGVGLHRHRDAPSAELRPRASRRVGPATCVSCTATSRPTT